MLKRAGRGLIGRGGGCLLSDGVGGEMWDIVLHIENNWFSPILPVETLEKYLPDFQKNEFI
ncbi:hypothetical protein JCM10550A_11350 [Methanogenium cariaci]